MREAKADEKEVMKMQKDMAKIAAGKKKPKKKVRENTRPLVRVRVLSRSVRVPHKACCVLQKHFADNAGGWMGDRSTPEEDWPWELALTLLEPSDHLELGSGDFPVSRTITAGIWVAFFHRVPAI